MHVNIKIKSCKIRFSWVTKLQMCNKQKANIMVLWRIFVMKTTTFLIMMCIFSSFTLLSFVSQVVIQMDRKVSYIYKFMYQSILHIICVPYVVSLFLSNLFSTENHLCYPAIYVTKIFRQNSEGLKRLILIGRVRGCCLGIEKYRQNSFVSPRLFFKLFLLHD